MRLTSQIIITQRPKEILAKLEELKRDEKIITIDSEERDFLVEHASLTIEKAFIASEQKEIITLIAPKFSIISQNKLLKILEEPPKNKEFILITKSKSSILPTIKSRLPIRVIKDRESKEKLDLDIENLNLAKVYEFVQKNRRISMVECKEMVEEIAVRAIESKRYNMDSSTLKIFSNSIKALDLGSPTSFILNLTLIKLLSKKI
jgi:DNA polymerase-3 subunit delta'